MTRTKRIQRIVALADVSRREASQHLARSRKAHDENVARLEQFRLYHAEYAKALGTGGSGMSAAAARELRGFLAQIERTIVALDQQLRLSAEQCNADIRTWQSAARRSGALGEILDTAISAAAQLDEGRLQREIDDRGVRRGGDD